MNTMLLKGFFWVLVLCSALPGQIRGLQLLHSWSGRPGADSTVMVDTTGGRHGKLIGAPKFVGQGKIDALVLDGEKDAVQITEDLASLSWPGLDLTLEAWVRPDAPPTDGEAGILSLIQDNGPFERGIWLGWQKQNFVFALVTATDQEPKATYLTARNPLELQAWHHVVATWDGETQRLYMDGKLQGESRERKGPIVWPEKGWLELGTYHDDNEWDRAKIAIHSVDVWRGVMTPQQVAERHARLRKDMPERKAQAVAPLAQPEMDRAIERGIRRLLAQQETDGTWRGSGGVHKHYIGMTALSLYTLLRCGLPSGHPAIKTARAWLDQVAAAGRITRTYDLGCALMAYAVFPEAERPLPQMQKLCDLVTKQVGNGSIRRAPRWGYPGNHDGEGDTWFDLSNTQYALLGLRAGMKSGLTMPNAEWWKRVADGLLEDQAAYGGFSYRGGNDLSASMTVAGFAGLIICQEMLGSNIDVRLGPKLRAGLNRAESWLASNWNVHGNRHMTDEGGFRNGWHLYYLYGLERVGSFLGVEQLGGRYWHAEGSRVILEAQKDDGGFGDDYDTCFALLFLQRGSRATSPAPRDPLVVAAEAKAPIVIGARGQLPIAAYLRTIDDATRAKLLAPEVRALRMVWWVQGEVALNLPMRELNDLFKPEHTLEYRFENNGPHKFQLAVDIMDPKGETVLESIKSQELEIPVDWVEEPRHRAAIRDQLRNLIKPDQVTATATSEHNDDYAARFAADGIHATSWVTKAGAVQPRLDLNFRRPISARALALTSARSYGGSANSYQRPKDVEISFNGGKPFVTRLNDTVLHKQEVSFGLIAIKSLSIRVQSWYRDASEPQYGGFKEIELFAEASPKTEGSGGTEGRIDWVIPLASGDREEWHYVFETPADGWMEPKFRPSGWKRGYAGFGSPGRTSANPTQTEWATTDLFARRSFRLTAKDLSGELKLEINHDDDVRVWVNGVLAVEAPGYSADGYRSFSLKDAVKETLVRGANTVAIHCRNTGGAAYFDLGIIRIAGP